MQARRKTLESNDVTHEVLEEPDAAELLTCVGNYSAQGPGGTQFYSRYRPR